jgi:hypothetical protein
MQGQDMRWPMLNRVLQQAQRMDQMMDRLGVDAGAAARIQDGKAFARARTLCLFCPAVKSCELWLEQSAVAPEPPSFCPNAEFFALCRASQAN